MYRGGAQQRPAHERDSERPIVRFDELSSMIRQKRRREQLTLQAAAQQSGVSAATLSRLERSASGNATGHSMPTPDVRTLSAIADWLDVAVAGAGSAPIEISGEAPLPNVVEAHLRADRNLDPDTAALLARVFRDAYVLATENGRDGAEKHAQKTTQRIDEEDA